MLIILLKTYPLLKEHLNKIAATLVLLNLSCLAQESVFDLTLEELSRV